MQGTHQVLAGTRVSAGEMNEHKPDEWVYRLVRAMFGLYLIPALVLVLLVGTVLIALDWLFQRAVDLLRFLTNDPKTTVWIHRAEFVDYSPGTRSSPLRNRSNLPAQGVYGLESDSVSRN